MGYKCKRKKRVEKKGDELGTGKKGTNWRRIGDEKKGDEKGTGDGDTDGLQMKNSFLY